MRKREKKRWKKKGRGGRREGGGKPKANRGGLKLPKMRLAGVFAKLHPFFHLPLCDSFSQYRPGKTNYLVLVLLY